MIPELTTKEIARFNSKIKQDGGCLVWTGPVNNKGYGRFEIYRNGGRIRILTHRLAYKLATGKEPAGLVRHKCDNPPCCNIADLLVGTQADNMADARERGRADYRPLAVYREARDALAYARLAAGIKRCSGCKQLKSVGDFHKARGYFAGLQSSCKSCSAELGRRYRARLKKDGVA